MHEVGGHPLPGLEKPEAILAVQKEEYTDSQKRKELIVKKKRIA